MIVYASHSINGHIYSSTDGSDSAAELALSASVREQHGLAIKAGRWLISNYLVTFAFDRWGEILTGGIHNAACCDCTAMALGNHCEGHMEEGLTTPCIPCPNDPTHWAEPDHDGTRFCPDCARAVNFDKGASGLQYVWPNNWDLTDDDDDDFDDLVFFWQNGYYRDELREGRT